MKTIFFFFIFITIAISVKAQQDFLPEEVSDNLYAIENPEGGNIAFLVTRKGVVVVDAGSSLTQGKQIVETIKEITNKPIKYLILTHMHSDHINGISGFPNDVKIIAHSKLNENNAHFNEPKIKSYIDSIMPGYIENLKEQLSLIENTESKEYLSLQERLKKNVDYLEDIKKIIFRTPDITFDDYYLLKIADQRIVLEYPGPCHTNDNIVVKFSNHNVIHVGDLVFNKEFPYTIDEHGVDIYNWIKTLDDLFEENIKTVIPGHGNTDNKYALKDQSEYFKQLSQKINRLKDEGMNLEEIIENCNADDYSFSENKNQFPVNIKVIYEQLINSKIDWWKF